jgi:hypothetical protein
MMPSYSYRIPNGTITHKTYGIGNFSRDNTRKTEGDLFGGEQTNVRISMLRAFSLKREKKILLLGSYDWMEGWRDGGAMKRCAER